MTQTPLYLAQVFGVFMWIVLYGVAVWGFFWILRKLVAPAIRWILTGWRNF